jgi:hypothetical protein
MTWPAGFLTTVTVAFVLCDMSASDELCKLAELSLRPEPLVLLDSVTDNVWTWDGGGCAPPIRLGSDIKFFAAMVFGSAFNGTVSSDAVEMVIDFESVLCMTREDSLSDDSTVTLASLLAGGCSAFGFGTSRSFSDIITASINI